MSTPCCLPVLSEENLGIGLFLESRGRPSNVSTLYVPWHALTWLPSGGMVSFYFIFSTDLLDPNLKKTIECAKKIVRGKEGMGAWWVAVYRACIYNDSHPFDLNIGLVLVAVHLWSKTSGILLTKLSRRTPLSSATQRPRKEGKNDQIALTWTSFLPQMLFKVIQDARMSFLKINICVRLWLFLSYKFLQGFLNTFKVFDTGCEMILLQACTIYTNVSNLVKCLFIALSPMTRPLPFERWMTILFYLLSHFMISH